MGILHSKQG